MGNSTKSIQNVYDYLITFPELKPGIAAGGYSLQPMLSIAQRVMNYMLSQAFPWKWNEFPIPYFYTNSYQQDYAVYGVTCLAWLQRGTILDVNNTSIPKPRFLVEVGRSLPQMSAGQLTVTPLANPRFIVNWYPNDQLYYGTWGGSPTSSGNDPVAGSVYINPLGAPSQPSNPITQIRDVNGNLLVLTTYGTEGTAAPLAAVNAAPGTTCSGTGATTQWTVVDPKGQGFRIAPPPSQTGTVWQFNLIGQNRPPVITSFAQLLNPIPDEYYTYFQEGCVAEAYRHAPEGKVRARFQTEYELWQQALYDARLASDREREEYGFVPDRPLIAPTGYSVPSPAMPYPGPSSY